MHKRPRPTHGRTQLVHVQKCTNSFGGVHGVLARQLFFLLSLDPDRVISPLLATILTQRIHARSIHPTQCTGPMDLESQSLQMLLACLAVRIIPEVLDSILDDQLELALKMKQRVYLRVAAVLFRPEQGSGRLGSRGALAVPSRVQSRTTRQTRKTVSVKVYFVGSGLALEEREEVRWRWVPSMLLCRMVEVATGGRS